MHDVLIPVAQVTHLMFNNFPISFCHYYLLKLQRRELGGATIKPVLPVKVGDCQGNMATFPNMKTDGPQTK